MLVDFLKFFESIMLDRRMYWRFESTAEPQTGYEIQWSKEDACHWRYRKIAGEHWSSVESDKLEGTLTILGIDQGNFERELRRSALQQVVFADMIIDKSIAFLGKETVDRAIADNKKFMNQLLEIIRKLTHNGETAADQSKEPDFPDKNRHLRIVP